MTATYINIKKLTINMHRNAPFDLGKFEVSSVGNLKPIERFELAHEGLIIIDHEVGLMWPIYESEQKHNFDESEKYAASLRLGGFEGWFNPERDQRESIIDLTRFSPALFEPLKSRSNSWEWTRTPVASCIENGVPRAFWQVGGLDGLVGAVGRDAKAFSRPCRFVMRPGQ